jgi:hypothetical protein
MDSPRIGTVAPSRISKLVDRAKELGPVVGVDAIFNHRHDPQRIDRSHLAIAIDWRKMAKRVTSVASRTWRLDRHGFGPCLGDVEVEARENPSWLAATIALAA